MIHPRAGFCILALATIGGTACGKEGAPDKKVAVGSKNGTTADKSGATAKPGAGSRVDIAVTEEGFVPDQISATKGQPMTLVFTRKTDKTCATRVVFHVSETEKINKELPLGQPVEIAVTFPTSGAVRYACDMDMVSGVITVQ